MESGDGRYAAIDQALEPLLGPVDVLPSVDWTGPDAWWGGALDVEGLARASVVLAVRAAAAAAEERGRPVRLGTSAQLVAAGFGSFEHLRVDGRAPVAFAPFSGWFQTADGWIRLHGNYRHHAAVIERTLGVRDRDSLVRVLRDLHSVETERRVRAAGGIAGAMRTADEWRTSEAGLAVDSRPWVGLDVWPRRSAIGPSDGLPLKGIRVLDLTRVLAGPTGTKLLATLGADVLRLDSPEHPELLDQHLDTGFGKRSASADLRDPVRLRQVHRLLSEADVLFTGYRPGSLARFGLDGPSLRRVHPHVAHVSLSAWGTEGPWGDQRGFDSIVQAVVGIGHRYGSVDGRGGFTPGALPVQALDHATGYGMAAAAMAMLAAGRAGHASLSLARTAHALLASGPARGPTHLLDVPTVETASPHGRLRHVPAPVTLDGEPIPTAPPGEYGAASLTWQ